MDAGTIGGILGIGIGFVGATLGTYFSIKNTQGPQERGFVIKASLLSWIAVTLFLVLLFTLPHSYNQLLWIPFIILLPLGVRFGNKRQMEIRQQEQAKN